MACYRCWRGELAMAGTKFSLLGFCALRAVQNSPCSASVLCERYKILPARLLCSASGTKFSLLMHFGPKQPFFRVLGEFCTGMGV